MRLVELIDRVPEATPGLDHPKWRVPDYAFALMQPLAHARPLRVKAVFMQRIRRSHLEPQTQHVVAVASFRSPFAVVERLARVLAPAVQTLEFTPVIVPLSEKELGLMTSDTPWLNRLLVRGVRLYSA